MGGLVRRLRRKLGGLLRLTLPLEGLLVVSALRQRGLLVCEGDPLDWLDD
jgi:hypothetical protein